jgi:hypothetical protein
MKKFKANGGRFPWRFYYETSEIDDLCVQALFKVGCLPEEPAPIQIDLFLEKYLHVSILPENLGPDFMGACIFNSKGNVTGILTARWLEEDSSPVAVRRLRTTLAHEGGHALLHQELFVADTTLDLFASDAAPPAKPQFLCRSSDISETATAAQPRYTGQWWEWQANRAIGGFLLPKPLVLTCATPLLRKTDSGWSLPEVARAETERVIADTFDVNPAVARIRLQEMFPQEISQNFKFAC